MCTTRLQTQYGWRTYPPHYTSVFSLEWNMLEPLWKLNSILYGPFLRGLNPFLTVEASPGDPFTTSGHRPKGSDPQKPGVKPPQLSRLLGMKWKAVGFWTIWTWMLEANSCHVGTNSGRKKNDQLSHQLNTFVTFHLSARARPTTPPSEHGAMHVAWRWRGQVY